jgi:hypothetical protein
MFYFEHNGTRYLSCSSGKIVRATCNYKSRAVTDPGVIKKRDEVYKQSLAAAVPLF